MTTSPCIKVCEIDPKNNICMGCGRTMKEISNWINMSDLEKEKLIFDLKDRVNKE